MTKVQFVSTANNLMVYAFAGDGTLESCVRPECHADFDKDKHLFLEVDEASRAQPGSLVDFIVHEEEEEEDGNSNEESDDVNDEEEENKDAADDNLVRGQFVVEG